MIRLLAFLGLLTCLSLHATPMRIAIVGTPRDHTGTADLLACDHDGSGQASFRSRDSQSGESKVRTLPGAEFLHLLLQHVLPKGIRRARNYGFLHPNKKGLIALLHLVLRIVPRPPTPHKPRPAFACPCCGKPMRILRRRLPPMAVSRPDSMQATETAV